MILPKAALAHLNVGEGDSVFLTEGPAGSLRLSLAKPKVTRKKAVDL